MPFIIIVKMLGEGPYPPSLGDKTNPWFNFTDSLRKKIGVFVFFLPGRGVGGLCLLLCQLRKNGVMGRSERTTLPQGHSHSVVHQYVTGIVDRRQDSCNSQRCLERIGSSSRNKRHMFETKLEVFSAAWAHLLLEFSFLFILDAHRYVLYAPS